MNLQYDSCFDYSTILGKAISHMCGANGLPQSTIVLDEQREHSYACFIMGEVCMYTSVQYIKYAYIYNWSHLICIYVTTAVGI